MTDNQPRILSYTLVEYQGVPIPVEDQVTVRTIFDTQRQQAILARAKQIDKAAIDAMYIHLPEESRSVLAERRTKALDQAEMDVTDADEEAAAMAMLKADAIWCYEEYTLKGKKNDR